MSEALNVVVVSSVLQDRKSLLQILDKLSLNVISCSTISQAKEVLERQEVWLVFCDESISDGSYRELLRPRKIEQSGPCLVITFHRGEWKEYLEAMRLGVFDAISWPFRPTDVESIVLRAGREHRETTTLHRLIA
jgi:DNA-binding NtrC family response regulator